MKPFSLLSAVLAFAGGAMFDRGICAVYNHYNQDVKGLFITSCVLIGFALAAAYAADLQRN